MDAAEFVTEIAVQFFFGVASSSWGKAETLLSLRHGQGKHLNNSGFLSSNSTVDTLMVVPSPQ
jgi:hypothetical protein